MKTTKVKETKGNGECRHEGRKKGFESPNVKTTTIRDSHSEENFYFRAETRNAE